MLRVFEDKKYKRTTAESCHACVPFTLASLKDFSVLYKELEAVPHTGFGFRV